MSKIYDALLRAELDRTAASGNRSDLESPEAILTRDILASLNQDAKFGISPRNDGWDTAVEPMPPVDVPEAIPVWNPSHPGSAAAQTEEDKPVVVIPMKTCPHCALPYGVRSERKGFFQKKMASFFGYFPWTCKACRTNFYSKDRGPSAAHGPSRA